MNSNTSENQPLLDNEQDIQEPKLYKVIMHNDDVTTMDFVVQVLVDVFHKSVEDASEIMMKIHTQGKEICGIYPREIAEFRIYRTLNLARSAHFPLLCTMEETD